MHRIGVFGGSFNPIHFGHLLVADDVGEILGLDRTLFVPAAVPPHKISADLAPARHRFHMTALAVRERPGFEACDLELKRPGRSYTVDTLEALAGQGDLHLLIGSETFLDLLSWKDPERVARLARLVVVPRNSAAFDPDGPEVQHVLSTLGLPGFCRTEQAAPPAPILVTASSLPISASDLRRRAREGRSLAYRIPSAVAAYIRRHGLYGVAR